MPLTVGNEDIAGVQVVTTKGATLSGVVVAAPGSTAPLPMGGIRLRRRPFPSLAGTAAGMARVESNGTFTLAGLLGPRVIRVAGLPQEWMLQSITVNGADVTDRVLEFTGNQEFRGARVT